MTPTPTPSPVFVSVDSRGVSERGLVTAESKGVEVALESADTRGSRKC